MIRYIGKRLLWMIPVMLGIAILIFSIMYICPGDPASSLLGPSATAVELAAKREEMGLNDPYIVRLGRYLYQTFIRFDLGTSYKFGTSVFAGLMERMQYTLVIALLCMALQIFVGTPLGITAATHHNGIADRICMFLALLGVSIPAFWLALMLVPSIRLVPKLKCRNTPFRYSASRTRKGLSSPMAILFASISAGVWVPAPRAIITGSPGTKFISVNTMMVTAISVGMRMRSLLRTYRPISLYPF